MGIYCHQHDRLCRPGSRIEITLFNSIRIDESHFYIMYIVGFLKVFVRNTYITAYADFFFNTNMFKVIILIFIFTSKFQRNSS